MFKPQLEQCPHCSETRHKSWLKTLQLYPDTGTYFCHHCRVFGQISDLNIGIKLERTERPKIQTEWNNRYERFTTVRPVSFSEGRHKFGIKSASGKIVGVHERQPHKRSNTTGKRLLGYGSSYLEFGQTYRIVEGPFDCIYPNDVCVFGIPGKEQSAELKPYKLILCPDGDIWNSEESVLKWFKPFLWNDVAYVERLPNDKDPDEVPEKERRILEWKKLKNWIYQNN